MESRYHECKGLEDQDIVTVQKVKGKWCWVFWARPNGNEAHGISFCPYCGEKLEN